MAFLLAHRLASNNFVKPTAYTKPNIKLSYKYKISRQNQNINLSFPSLISPLYGIAFHMGVCFYFDFFI